MLPRQLNGHFIAVGLRRRGEDLVVVARYDVIASSYTKYMLINFYICLTLPLNSGNPTMSLQRQGQTQLYGRSNLTELAAYPCAPWKTFHRDAPPSVMLRVFPKM